MASPQSVSRADVEERVVRLLGAGAHLSPDLLAVSPDAGNCGLLEGLLDTAVRPTSAKHYEKRAIQDGRRLM